MGKLPLHSTLMLMLMLFSIVVFSQCAEIKDRAGALIEGIKPPEPDRPSATVTARHLNLRKGPSTEAEVLAVLEKGERVRVERREGTWVNVVTRGGKKGWVHARYLAGLEGSEYGSAGPSKPQIAQQQAVEASPASQAEAPAEKPTPKEEQAPVVSESPTEMGEMIFQEEAAKSGEAPAARDESHSVKSSPPLLTASAVQADKESPEEKQEEDLVKGPWANAVAGTRIQYRILRDMPLRQVPVTVTEEVIEADEAWATVAVKREWEEDGKSKSDETRARRARLVQAAELKKFMARFGSKMGEESLTVGDKEVRCDIYERRQTLQSTSLSGETRTIQGVFHSYLNKEVAGWQVRVRMKTDEVDEVRWQLLDYQP